MTLGIEGKVAMVAAGTRGIGAAAAKALAAEGAKVSVCGRSAAPGAYRCDLNSAADIKRWHEATVKDLGRPSILVTNTGGPPAGLASALAEEQWKQGFESTVLNVVRLVALVAPGMKEQGWGRVVHITSLVAKDPEPMLAISSTLRAGLSSLCRLQAKELGPFGITVNSLLPGHTATDRQTHLLEKRSKASGRSVEEERRLSCESIPLKRMARPEEMGDAIAFLCSERASYVNGALLLVDGGLSGGLG